MKKETKTTLKWAQPDGRPVSCTEKIKVLNQNNAEIMQLLQDAFEDAVLMGCSVESFKTLMIEQIQKLEHPYEV